MQWLDNLLISIGLKNRVVASDETIDYNQWPNEVLKTEFQGVYHSGVERVLRFLVDNRDLVKPVKSPKSDQSYYYTLQFDDLIFEIWSCNYPYAICTRINVYKAADYIQAIEEFGWVPSSRTILAVEQAHGSRETVWEFLRYFGQSHLTEWDDLLRGMNDRLPKDRQNRED